MTGSTATPTSSTAEPRLGVAALLLVIGLAVLGVVGCGDESRTGLVADVQIAPGQELDIHFPEEPGQWPSIVVIHGAGSERESYRRFAELLAQSGAVVFNADWRVLTGHVENSLEDIACAVRYAKLHAAEYGGDPERTLLVGHSTGAAYAGEVATNGNAYSGACELEASATTEGLVLISPAQVPGGRPWRHSSLGLNQTLRISILHGTRDVVIRPSLSTRTAKLLEEAAYQVSLKLLDGGHSDLVAADLEPGPGLVISEEHPVRAVIEEIVRLTGQLD